MARHTASGEPAWKRAAASITTRRAGGNGCSVPSSGTGVATAGAGITASSLGAAAVPFTASTR
ncbi:MAG: hypothetical protein QM767_19585 [Anaeromyxobacter sp.]